MRAYPGTTWDWWQQQMHDDEQLVATAIDLAAGEGDDDDGHDG